MKKETMYYNAKPSELGNIGEDVSGAARHRNDTYENPEQARQKAQAKQGAKSAAALRKSAAAILTPENYLDVINIYEVQRLVLTNPETFKDLKIENVGWKTAKTQVWDYLQALKLTDSKAVYAISDKFNRMSRLVRRNEYRVTSFEKAEAYFNKPKHAPFVEQNGRKTEWKSQTGLSISDCKSAILPFLASNVKALQFGNSVPDSERVYCAEEMKTALEQMQSIFSFDWKTVGFSFGSRGHMGSIAHYEPDTKMIQTNRHWEGAMAHEMGHAIDYALGAQHDPKGRPASSAMPRPLVEKYRKQIWQNPAAKMNYQYYTNPVEIFARAFEQYVRELLSLHGVECSAFLQTTRDPSVMPEMCPDMVAFLDSVLAPILHKKAGV